MSRDITQIRKVIKTSLIKERIRDNLKRCYNWYDEQMRVRSQACAAFHMPELLREYIFEKNYSRLNEAREIYYKIKTRILMHIALVSHFEFLFYISQYHLGIANKEDYQYQYCYKIILRNRVLSRIIVAHITDETYNTLKLLVRGSYRISIV